MNSVILVPGSSVPGSWFSILDSRFYVIIIVNVRRAQSGHAAMKERLLPGRPSTKLFVQQAQQAGYRVIKAEQLRANRWLLTLQHAETALLMLVQARPLIGATDVQDLADLVALRRAHQGILLAHAGAFSQSAVRTQAEIGRDRIRLVTVLPPTPPTEPGLQLAAKPINI